MEESSKKQDNGKFTSKVQAFKEFMDGFLALNKLSRFQAPLEALACEIQTDLEN